ncbi:hypothetical protein QAD02_018470 [Eretmocerus hayati]|uniref:Uncharacterized protein n=1 Tax=Eretmocerus hayati TaxID=131215 RepID=A0ACC2PI11_9HYME|nr:hypothetical protein QAD02_018470 [Eretmocerus hayati]
MSGLPVNVELIRLSHDELRFHNLATDEVAYLFRFTPPLLVEIVPPSPYSRSTSPTSSTTPSIQPASPSVRSASPSVRSASSSVRSASPTSTISAIHGSETPHSPDSVITVSSASTHYSPPVSGSSIDYSPTPRSPLLRQNSSGESVAKKLKF